VFKFEETRIPVTISVGVASIVPDMHDPSEFIKVADDKLYQAKSQGRNQVVG
jgi:diguanylate cyclase (GGDEF)-like protein